MRPTAVTGGSDERHRLTQIVARLFTRPYPSLRLPGGSTAGVHLGADALDDCAVLSFSGDIDVVVGSDYVRASRFRLYELGLLTEYDLGWYVTAANMSDVAAMGALPLAFLSVVRYPHEMSDASFEAVLRGIRDCCESVDAANVGGDIGSAERLILSGTALGVVERGGSLLRRGARPDDVVVLTGPTGVAGAALAFFASDKQHPGVSPAMQEALLNAWRHPVPRIREGLELRKSGLVTSCIDTSDGLKGALEALSASSNVGFEIDEQSLVVPGEVAAVAGALGVSTNELLLGDSVDFQLLATVGKSDVGSLRAHFDKCNLSMATIGVVTTTPVLTLRTADGTVALPGESWRHQRRYD